MANTTPITKWLINRKELFKLSFKQYGWTEKYLPMLHDFTAEISFNGISSQGRGTDLNAELAIEKASAEAIERYVCKILKMDSTGLSVSGEVSSTEHAKFEALERYYLNYHLSRKIPFLRIDEREIDITLKNMLQWFEDKFPSTFISFHQMHTSIHGYGVVAFIEDTSLNCFSFGFAYDKSISLSLKRSFLESIPNFAAQREKKDAILQVNSLPLNSQEKTPWHLSQEFLSQISPLLFSESPSSKLEPYNLNPIDFEILKIELAILPEFADCPIEPIKVIIREKETKK